MDQLLSVSFREKIFLIINSIAKVKTKIKLKRGQMIDKADYEFINRFDSNNPVEREKILNHPTERIDVFKFFLYLKKKIIFLFSK